MRASYFLVAPLLSLATGCNKPSRSPFNRSKRPRLCRLEGKANRSNRSWVPIPQVKPRSSPRLTYPSSRRLSPDKLVPKRCTPKYLSCERTGWSVRATLGAGVFARRARAGHRKTCGSLVDRGRGRHTFGARHWHTESRRTRSRSGCSTSNWSPTFDKDKWLYLSYYEPRDGGNGLAVARFKFEDGAPPKLTAPEIIFRMMPTLDSTKHAGGRLVFSHDGLLFVTLGERSILEGRKQARDLASHSRQGGADNTRRQSAAGQSFRR